MLLNSMYMAVMSAPKKRIMSRRASSWSPLLRMLLIRDREDCLDATELYLNSRFI